MSATEQGPPGGGTAPETPPPKHHTKIGHFIEKYSTFLSSFVLGFAGLVGTAIYQHQQTKISNRQAEAQIAVSEKQGDTQWKIARAEILSKNLQVLLDRKPDTVEQRYGVLLSLTREDVLDPELAMSYAFDLDNAEYIKSVILSITKKSYAQIFHNFKLTCELRYGFRREVPVCRAAEAFEARAEALSEVIAEELDRGSKDPYKLVADEKQVRTHLMRLVYLFGPYLRQAYERQRYSDIDAFESRGRGAQLVAAFVLAADPSEEFVGAEAAAQRGRFHAERAARIEKATRDPACDVECRGLMAEVLLNGLPEYGPAYAGPLRALLVQHGAESSQVYARLHRRLLWCQVEPPAVRKLIGDVLLPAWQDLQRAPVQAAAPAKKDKEKEGKGGKDKAGRDKNGKEAPEAARPHEKPGDEILDLLALFDPLPPEIKLPDPVEHAVEPRRARSRKERESPPPAFRNQNFCAAKGEAADTDEDL